MGKKLEMFIKTGINRSDSKRKLDVLVSDEDYDLLSQFNWQVDSSGMVRKHRDKRCNYYLMHRLILKAPPHLEVDHINGNRLDNRRSNLRLCNSSENKKNRGIRCDTKSGYKGVSWYKHRSKWGARIMIGNVYKHLGLFEDKIEAAKVYNEAAKKYHKEFAWLNPV